MLEARLLILRKIRNLHKREGWRGVKRKLGTVLRKHIATLTRFDKNDYAKWVRRYDTLDSDGRAAIMRRIAQMPPQLISVVMPITEPGKDTELELLSLAIRSVQEQLYPHWELTIVGAATTPPLIKQKVKQFCRDDSRINFVFGSQDDDVFTAVNEGLSATSGQWVTLLGCHDVLSVNALFHAAGTILANPEIAIIYSDEDEINTTGARSNPIFKPDWDPELFLSCNMIGGMAIYRSCLIREVGGIRSEYEGAYEYDLAIRCTEQITPMQISHIPKVLYHRRTDHATNTQNGTSMETMGSARAIADHFQRNGIQASTELTASGGYRVKYALPLAQPLVSVIIPTRNGLALIRQCVESIFAKTSYVNYEVIVVDNNSDEPDTLRYLASLENMERVHVLRDPRPFNYSALNNKAATIAQGAFLCLLNNDIEVISSEWLTEMVSLAIQPGVGAVGARLWYPDDTLQHGGVITGIGGVAGHFQRGLPRGDRGYFRRAELTQSFSVVTAACLLVKIQVYRDLGGLDENNLSVAFNDVDFCLRVRQAGLRNIWTPYAELYHHESATRGQEDTFEKYDRYSKEFQYMRQRWADVLESDPAYNPNLTLEDEHCGLAWPPRQ